MRYVVCREGIEEFRGSIVEVGGLTVAEGDIFVTFNYSHHEKHYGKAVDFQREIKGDMAELSFELEFFDPQTETSIRALTDHGDLAPGVYVTDVIFAGVLPSGHKAVKSGVIREVSFYMTSTGANPGARIDG